MNHLTIGKVAKSTGFGVETVRYYEREGLLGPAERTDANYRIYKPEDIDRLHFIKRAKDLGFTLKEIGELLALRHDPTMSKADVKRKTQEKITDIRSKIDDLGRILNALEQLNDQCDGHGPIGDCPILKALTKDGGHKHQDIKTK